MDVEEVADELYGLDPSVFVAARTGRVAQAKARKDRDAARALAALRKPTTVGWLVNLLARESPDDVSAVLALGDALRQAQRRLDPTALRELSDQRQRVVRALAERAGRLAAERGRVVGEAALREVAQTLHAAMADPDLARTVERGRVLCAARYSGFGPAVLESVGRGERSAAAPRRLGKALAQRVSVRTPGRSRGPSSPPPAPRPRRRGRRRTSPSVRCPGSMRKPRRSRTGWRSCGATSNIWNSATRSFGSRRTRRTRLRGRREAISSVPAAGSRRRRRLSRTATEVRILVFQGVMEYE